MILHFPSLSEKQKSNSSSSTASSGRVCLECRHCNAFGRCKLARSERHGEIVAGMKACGEFR